MLGEGVDFDEVFDVWTAEEAEKFECYQHQAIEFKRQAYEQESLAMKVEEQMNSNSVENLGVSMKKSTDYRNEAESKLDKAHKAGIQALEMFHHLGRLAQEVAGHKKHMKASVDEIKIIKGRLVALEERAAVREAIVSVSNLEEKDALKARKEQVSNNWQAAIVRAQATELDRAKRAEVRSNRAASDARDAILRFVVGVGANARAAAEGAWAKAASLRESAYEVIDRGETISIREKTAVIDAWNVAAHAAQVAEMGAMAQEARNNADIWRHR
jgi:hypothetical protein